MNEILTIVLSAIGVILTGLATWATTAITSWLNTKVKDKKLAGYLSQISTIVISAVQSVYQTYVQSLKDNGSFDETAQKEALSKALAIIKGQLTSELTKFIEDNYGDINDWLTTQIESAIYSLKK